MSTSRSSSRKIFLPLEIMPVSNGAPFNPTIAYQAKMRPRVPGLILRDSGGTTYLWDMHHYRLVASPFDQALAINSVSCFAAEPPAWKSLDAVTHAVLFTGGEPPVCRQALFLGNYRTFGVELPLSHNSFSEFARLLYRLLCTGKPCLSLPNACQDDAINLQEKIRSSV